MINLRGCLAFLWSWLANLLYFLPGLVVLLLSRKAAYSFSKYWCQQVLDCGGVKIEFHGLEKIDPTRQYTVICNHQSFLDIKVLIAAFPLYLYFLAKKELFDIPLFGWCMRLLGHIPIDRKNPRNALSTFAATAQRIHREKHVSLALFPEGTRSPDGQLGEFKTGLFSLVIKAGLPVLPVCIQGILSVQPRNSLFTRPGLVTLTLGDPLDISAFKDADKTRLAQLVHRQIQSMAGLSQH